MTATLRSFRCALLAIALTGAFGCPVAKSKVSGVPAPVRPQMVLQLGHNGVVESASYSRDGRLLATVGMDGNVCLWDAATGLLERTLSSRSKNMNAVCFSPDGRTVAAGSVDGVFLWNVGTGALLHQWTKAWSGVLFSPDGKSLIASSNGGAVRVWNPVTGALIRMFSVSGGYAPVAIAPDGRLLATAGERGTVHLWDFRTGVLVRALQTGGQITEDSYLTSLAFSPDGARLAVGVTTYADVMVDRPGARPPAGVILWNVRTGKRLAADPGNFTSLAFIQGGRVLVAAGGPRHGEGLVCLWRFGTHPSSRTFQVEGGQVRTMSMAPGEYTMALVSDVDGRVRLAATSTGLTRTVLSGHDARVSSMAVSPGGNMLAANSVAGRLLLWDLNRGALTRSLPLPSAWMQPVVFSADGLKVFAGGTTGRDQGEVRIWDAQSGTLERTIPIPHGVGSLALSPDGKWMATGSDFGPVMFWELPGGRLLRELTANAMTPQELAFSADSRWLAAPAPIGEHGLKIFDVKSGEWSRQWGVSKSWTVSLLFHPDGKLAATGSMDGAVTVWDAASSSLQGHVLFTFHDHKTLVRGLAFSPDGGMLASGDDSGIIKLWDLQRGLLLRSLPGHDEGISALAFLNGGRTLASSGFDGSEKMWDTGTGKLQTTFLSFTDSASEKSPLEWIAFSPDGRYDGSPNIERWIQWKVGNRLAPGSTFKRVFHRPTGVVPNPSTTATPAPVVPGPAVYRDAKRKPDLPTSPISAAPGAAATSVPDGGRDRTEVPRLVLQRGHSDHIMDIQFSADGALMASGSEDGALCLWDTQTWDLKNKIAAAGGSATMTAFALHGLILSVGHADGSIELLEVPSGQLLRSLSGGAGPAASLAFSPDGQTLAVGGIGVVQVWDWTQGRLQRELKGFSGYVQSLSISRSGKILASGESGAHTWQLSTGESLHSFGLTGKAFFVPDRPAGAEEWIVSSAGAMLDLQGRVVRTMAGAETGGRASISFARDGGHVLIGDENGTMAVCDINTGRLIRHFQEPYSGTTAAALSPDGTVAVQGWESGEIKIWDVATGKLVRTLAGFLGGINSIALSADGARLISGGDDGILRWWNLHAGLFSSEIVGAGGPIESVALSSDNTLLSARASKVLVTWDGTDNRLLTRIPLKDYNTKIAYRPGSSFVGDGASPQPSLWDVRSGKRVRLYGSPSLERAGGHAAFSPGGKTFAVIREGGVALWDAESGDPQKTLRGFGDAVNTIVFSPDGKFLIGGTSDAGENAVEVWDLHTGSLIKHLTGHAGWVLSVAVSPDEKWIASGSMDGTARIWDFHTGARVATLAADQFWVNELLFTPDCRHLITAGNDDTIRCWTAPEGRLLLTLALLPSGSQTPAITDWIAYTPEGYYTGSAGVGRWIRWRLGNRLLPASATEQTFHRPEQVVGALK